MNSDELTIKDRNRDVSEFRTAFKRFMQDSMSLTSAGWNYIDSNGATKADVLLRISVAMASLERLEQECCRGD